MGKAKMGAEAKYVVASKNEQCTGGPLTEAECQAALKQLGAKWDGNRNWGDRCSGCLMTPSDKPQQVNFNTNGNGRCQHRDQLPICKKTTKKVNKKPTSPRKRRG